MSFGNFLQSFHEGGSSQCDPPVLVDPPNVSECLCHLVIQLSIDIIFVPLEILLILDPLKE
jgi:hypothetical protein